MGTLIVKVVTLGCKVNQCESASIVSTLKKSGYDASEGLAPADVYILNTCSVTSEADRKSRQYLTKMRKLNKDCRIIVVGCSSQKSSSQFHKDNVIAVGGSTKKSEFTLNTVSNLCKNNQYSTISDIILNEISAKIGCNYDYECTPMYDRTRAYVKIQDGCNRFCSYCIIPYLRGRSRSRSVKSVVEECANVASEEIVLVGIDMSVYGKDIGSSLCELLRALKDIKPRKRLGSLECEVIDESLLEAMKAGDFCPHFHLSLQSGNNDVLKSMNRHYDVFFYMQKLELIRKYFPLAGITTDVIVGFPTETDELFDRSCEFIKACEFSDIHVFPYSAREGTVAYKKYAELPKSVIGSRVDKLLEIKRAAHAEFLRKNIGTTADVYTETRQNGIGVGYTPNYIKVYSHSEPGTINKLRLIRPYLDGLSGENLSQ